MKFGAKMQANDLLILKLDFRRNTMGTKMNPANCIALILVIVGGLNWGLVGAADFNLVNKLFGGSPALEKIIYILVGLAAIWVIFQTFYCGGKCEEKAK